MERTQERYDGVAARLEWPMLVLALLYLPVLLVPIFIDEPPLARAILGVLDLLIWLSFVAEFVTLWVLAPDRKAMVRSHWLDLVIILVPFLRPLRAARALRLLRFLAIFGRAGASVRRLMTRPGLQGFMAFAAASIVFAAAVAFVFERSRPESSIDTFGDSLWWAVVTATTVGYGDTFPVTVEGRIAAVLLMLVGIGLLSVVTANIAALLIEDEQDDDLAEIKAQLDRIEAQLLKEGTGPG